MAKENEVRLPGSAPTAEALLYGVMLLQKKIRRTGTIERREGCRSDAGGPSEGARFAQQEAYQPSGNGTSGHARWLSLVAFGASSNIGGWAKKSSCGAGSIAILTASSNRSNSTSLIALSGFRERRVSKVVWFQIERIAQIVSIRQSRLIWLLMS
jgi:hypothetical protein